MDPRPTLRDVAGAAGVSMATVSMVLNGREGVSADTRQRVLEAAERLGYQKRATRASNCATIGVLIERLPLAAFNDPTVGMMLHGVESEASRRGYHMLLASLEPGTTELPPMVRDRQVAGVIVLGGGDIGDAYIRQLSATGLPIVLADNYVDGLTVPCVLADNEAGAYRITRHLIDAGHRRIAVLTGPPKYKTLTERLAGYRRALAEAGLEADPALIVAPVHRGPRKGYYETEGLLALPREQWPTAIFAISDKTALGALDALRAAGLRVPHDLALVGFDDITESAHLTPPLTTVRLPMQQIGTMAVQRLVELLDGSQTIPSKTILYTEVVVRASSGAYLDTAAG